MNSFYKNHAKKNQSGIALMMVLIALTVLATLGLEMGKIVSIEYLVSRNAQRKIQSYYLSKSMAKLAFLRIYIYKELSNIIEGGDPAIKAMIPKDILDQVWSTSGLAELPLIPNPEFPWPGKMSGTINTEGSKIPINLISGDLEYNSSPEIAAEVKRQVTKIIESLLETEEFDELYRGIEAEDLINPIIDWVDVNNDAIEGGDESREYEDLTPPYKPRNGPMPHISELHMVKGWTDDLISRIASNFSVYNTKLSINPNYISLQRLRFFEPNLTDEDLAEVSSRRKETPFNSLEDMEKFIQVEIRNGRDFEFPDELKGHVKETIFKVETTGRAGKSTANLNMVIKIESEKPTKACLDKIKKAKKKSQNPNSSGNNPPNSAKKDNLGKKCGKKCNQVCKLLDPEVLLIEEP